MDNKIFFGRITKNEKVDTNENKLEIFVDKKVFNDAHDKIYLKNRKGIRVQGFRTGKVPSKVLERIYGKDIFLDETIQLIYSNIISDIIKDSKLDVIYVKDLDVVEADEEKGLTFTIVFVLKPEVELKKYKGFEIKKPARKIKKEDIDKRINELRENTAKIINVEDKGYKAKKGDLVIIDFEGFIDGMSFEGGRAKNYKLKLGSSSFIEGFEDQIVGHKINDRFDVEVKFPKNYHAKDLREKDALFMCTLKEIKKLELPKEDDEFAKDVSEFDSLEKLREDIEKKLKKSMEDRENMEVERRLLKSLIDNINVSIPEIMFEKRYESLREDFARRIGMQGLTINRYFVNYGIEEEDFNRDLRRQAEIQVKTDLALEKLIELENLKVEEQELDKEWEKISKDYKMDIENIKNIFKKEVVEREILRRKAIEFLKENAKIEQEEVGA